MQMDLDGRAAAPWHKGVQLLLLRRKSCPVESGRCSERWFLDLRATKERRQTAPAARTDVEDGENNFTGWLQVLFYELWKIKEKSANYCQKKPVHEQTFTNDLFVNTTIQSL